MTTDQDRERSNEAWQAWRDAEKAYRDEAAKYVAVMWEDQPPAGPAKVVTHEALQLLTELRAAAQTAQDAYRAVSQAERR